MPPPKEPRPDEAQLASFVVVARGRARRSGRDEPRLRSAIVPHRLNRKEYANAIRDLLALESTPRRSCRRTKRSSSFDNIASGAAGVAVVHRAIRRSRRGRSRVQRRRPARCAHRRPDLLRAAGHAAIARRGLAARHARRRSSSSTMFPSDGEYEVNIADMFGPHLGQRHGVREHRRRDARRQDRLSRRRSAAKRT